MPFNHLERCSIFSEGELGSQDREASGTGVPAERNGAVTSRTRSGGASANPIVQRLVASASEGAQDDRVFLNTTLTAQTLVGGKIKKLSATDFTTDFGSDTEALAITAHGSANQVGDYTGAEVAEKLVDETTGLADGNHDIHFQSCSAAQEAKGKDKKMTSVVKTVRTALEERASDAGWKKVPKVTGSTGPQIVTRVPKDDGSGEYDIEKAVVDPGLLSYAGDIQQALINVLGDVKTKVDMDYSKDGVEFIKKAEADEEDVREFKLIFIHLIRGEPSKVESGTLKKIKDAYKKLGGRGAKAIFDRGHDFRSSPETLVLE